MAISGEQPLPSAIRRAAARLAGWRSGQMAPLLDNIIYRREIHMTPAGRLRRDSPVFIAHTIMLGCLLMIALQFPFGGWAGVCSIILTLAALLVFGGWPAAYFQARESVQRERATGELEQIYLTSLSHYELFEGKFYGALAPWLEARRYLMLFGVLLCFGVEAIAPGPWWLLAAALWLTAINQFGVNAVFGILSGLKKAASGPRSEYQPLADWRLNPFAYHLLLILQVGLIVIIPIAALAWLSPGSLRFQYPAFALTLFIPFYASIHLHNYEAAQRERLASDFRSVFSFELST